jgi:hypothetical protein
MQMQSGTDFGGDVLRGKKVGNEQMEMVHVKEFNRQTGFTTVESGLFAVHRSTRYRRIGRIFGQPGILTITYGVG